MEVIIPAAESLTKAERAYILVLFDECYDKLYRVAYRHLSDICKDSIEDVIQETFRRACENFKKMSAYDSAEAWLVGTCHHIALDEVERCAHILELREADHKLDDIPVETLEQILPLGLSDEDRQMLTLYYVAGYKTKEIAEIMDLTPAATRKRLSRLKELLKKKIKL